MMEKDKNIRIEEVADINYDYPYLEIFYKNSSQPFLEIGITQEKEFKFKFYSIDNEIDLSIDELCYVIDSAKEFLPKVLKNEEDFQKWDNKQ